MPYVDDRYSQVTLEHVACNEDLGEAWKYIDKCGSSSYDVSKAPFNGLSSATSSHSLYYQILAAIKILVSKFLPDYNILDQMRVAQGLLFSATFAWILYSLLSMGLTKLFAIFGVLAVSTNDTIFLNFSTVNSDLGTFLIVAISIHLLKQYKVFENKVMIPLFPIFVVTSIASVIKANSIPVVFFIAFLALIYSKFEHNQTESKTRQQNDKVISKEFFSIISVITFASLFGQILRVIQNALKGDYGPNEMSAFFQADFSIAARTLATAIAQSFSPFSTNVWGEWNILIMVIVSSGIVFVAFVFQGIRLSKIDLVFEREKLISLLLLSTLAAPIILVIGSFMIEGSAFTQKRYYQSTVIAGFFSAMITNKHSEMLRAVVMLIAILSSLNLIHLLY
jgi:hypothetical protein